MLGGAGVGCHTQDHIVAVGVCREAKPRDWTPHQSCYGTCRVRCAYVVPSGIPDRIAYVGLSPRKDSLRYQGPIGLSSWHLYPAHR